MPLENEIPEPQLPLSEMVSALQSQGGTITAQVQVIRKETGKAENYILILTPED